MKMMMLRKEFKILDPKLGISWWRVNREYCGWETRLELTMTRMSMLRNHTKLGNGLSI